MKHKIEFKSADSNNNVTEWSMEVDALYDRYFNGEDRDIDLPRLEDGVFDCYIVSQYDQTEIYCETFKELIVTLFCVC